MIKLKSNYKSDFSTVEIQINIITNLLSYRNVSVEGQSSNNFLTAAQNFMNLYRTDPLVTLNQILTKLVRLGKITK